MKDVLIVNNPDRWEYGLKVVVLGRNVLGNVIAELSESEIRKIPDQRFAPAPGTSLFRPSDLITESQFMPVAEWSGPESPVIPRAEEICGCTKPGSDCGFCQSCNIYIKGTAYDRHSWRHYVISDTLADVLGLLRGKDTHHDSHSDVRAMGTFSDITEPPSQKAREASQTDDGAEHSGKQVSLWDL